MASSKRNRKQVKQRLASLVGFPFSGKKTLPLVQRNEAAHREVQGCLKVGTVKLSEEHCRDTGLDKRTHPSRMLRQVRFSDVEVHNHNITLGDNPAVEDGPPLTLDWKSVKSERFNVEEHQSFRNNRGRRDSDDLVVPGWLRSHWLREEGIPMRRIIKAQKEVEAIKRSREAEKEKVIELEIGQVAAKLASEAAHRTNS